MTEQPAGMTRRLAVAYEALSRCLRAAGHEVTDLDRQAIAAGIVDALGADEAGRPVAVRPGWLPPAGFRDTLNARPDVPRALSELSLEDQMHAGLEDPPYFDAFRQAVSSLAKRADRAMLAVYNTPAVAALPHRQRVEVAQQTVHVLTDPMRPVANKPLREVARTVAARTGAPVEAVEAAVLAAVTSLRERDGRVEA